MTDPAGPLLLVGCGKMGRSLLDGWLDRGLAPEQVTIIEPSDLPITSGCTIVSRPDELPAAPPPAVVVFAVKPQMMDDVVPDYRRFAWPETVFLSVAAGRTLSSFANALGDGAAVVRAMPNTPASVRRGITVACTNRHVTLAQRDLCSHLLAAVGDVLWIDEEDHMDAVTAVSGSGPAYVFHMVEALAQAGVSAGLPPDLAGQLARATVAGAGALLDGSTEPPEILRQNVTSPGGTTAAAMDVLMGEGRLQELLEAAVAAAARRSRELAD